jgi:SAM-dependent methyltransferase
VDLEGFAEVLLSCAPFAPGESFIDLGSGTGKAVLCAAALAPFKRATGVEFVRPLHDAAQRLADAAAPLLAELGGGAAAEVRMKLGDALDEDLSRAGVVFAATTCWSDDALARLTTACARAKKGARLINMTRRLALPAADWELLRKVRAQYGRGRMTFFVYRKKT